MTDKCGKMDDRPVATATTAERVAGVNFWSGGEEDVAAAYHQWKVVVFVAGSSE